MRTVRFFLLFYYNYNYCIISCVGWAFLRFSVGPPLERSQVAAAQKHLCCARVNLSGIYYLQFAMFRLSIHMLHIVNVSNYSYLSYVKNLSPIVLGSSCSGT